MHNEERAPDIRIDAALHIFTQTQQRAPPLHSLANLPPDVITRAITGR